MRLFNSLVITKYNNTHVIPDNYFNGKQRTFSRFHEYLFEIFLLFFFFFAIFYIINRDEKKLLNEHN